MMLSSQLPANRNRSVELRKPTSQRGSVQGFGGVAQIRGGGGANLMAARCWRLIGMLGATSKLEMCGSAQRRCRTSTQYSRERCPSETRQTAWPHLKSRVVAISKRQTATESCTIPKINWPCKVRKRPQDVVLGAAFVALSKRGKAMVGFGS